MQTPLKYLEELPIGSKLMETENGWDNNHHTWYRDENGIWHCECDGLDVDWTWAEMIQDIGPLTYKYEVEIPNG